VDDAFRTKNPRLAKAIDGKDKRCIYINHRFQLYSVCGHDGCQHVFEKLSKGCDALLCPGCDGHTCFFCWAPGTKAALNEDSHNGVDEPPHYTSLTPKGQMGYCRHRFAGKRNNKSSSKRNNKSSSKSSDKLSESKSSNKSISKSSGLFGPTISRPPITSSRARLPRQAKNKNN
jgi:hypothetical protein